MPKLSRNDLFNRDNSTRNVHDSFVIFDAFTVENYRHGRCHLLALVMADITGMPIGLYVDEYADENIDGAPIWALEHAFCHSIAAQGFLADAKGLSASSALEDEYLIHANEPGELVGDEARHLISSWMSSGKLDDFFPGEYTALHEFVTQMKTLELLSICKLNVFPGTQKPPSLANKEP